MSNPNYVHTITLYRQQDGSWTRTVLEGCFFKAVENTLQTGTQVTKSNTYTVRIPIEVVGAGFTVRPGDFVISGECTDEIGAAVGFRAAEVLNRYKPNAFKVTTVSDNTGHRMDKHYRLGG